MSEPWVVGKAPKDRAKCGAYTPKTHTSQTGLWHKVCISRQSTSASQGREPRCHFFPKYLKISSVFFMVHSTVHYISLDTLIASFLILFALKTHCVVTRNTVFLLIVVFSHMSSIMLL